MFCRDCGEKLSLRFLENEGLVPFCPKCDKFKFPFFPVAVSMTVVNRDESKILLGKHVGDEDYKLIAGYVKKGESVEKTIPRELKEETDLTAVKWRYFGSRYHNTRCILMLNFIVTVNEGETKLGEELEEVRWCTPEEAKSLIRPNSTAEYFLLSALPELGKKR
ncbi:MAG: NUDIX domain-containing protein [Clostridia bacterium]|nr:NUDIX domain-containing protein [Clostridia bacterium]